MKLAAAAVLLFLGCALAARYNNNPYKTKRIIKVRVPPRQHPDFYNGPKGYLRPSTSPFRFKDYNYKHREYPRPSNVATYYSVSNIYSNHHVRPPPQALPDYSFSGATFGKGYSKEIYQKFPPTYGSSFPHKKPLSTFKFPSLKDEIRITHSQPSSPSPAPALTSSSLQSTSSPSYRPTSFYESSPHAHVQSFEDNRGPIREIPAPNLGPKPADANVYSTYGKGPSIDVTNLVSDSGEQQLTFPATEYFSVFGQTHNYDVINDNHLSTTSVYNSGLYQDGATSSLQTSQETGSESGIAAKPSPEIAFKNNHVTVTPVPSPSSGYEVTEEHHASGGATPTNNAHYYYAPDPDPSLPVHKVPPTKEVPTEGKNLVETYIPQQNFQILEGGSVAAPITTLSTQELFNLMHGFPRQVPIVAEPVVAILGHHQQGGLYLQPSYTYAQTGNDQYPIQSTGHEQYSIQTAGHHQYPIQSAGNEQYSIQTAGHHQYPIQSAGNEQYSIQTAGHHQYPVQSTGNVQYSIQSTGNGQAQQLLVSQQGTYVPQQQYQTTYTQISSDQSQNSNDYQYEPEASESRETGSQMKMDEDAPADRPEDQLGNQIIIHFNKLPEVPFYTTLPNKEAAEALASLQAAGSIGSNYVDHIKVTSGEKELNSVDNAVYTQLRGDQGPEKEEEGEQEVVSLGLTPQQLVTPQQVQVEDTRAGTLSDVEIQKSVSVFETSYPARNLLDDSSAPRAPGSDSSSESFGKRIRPK